MFGTFRFILALNVMMFHILDVPIIGSFAVYSFFILSGFLMTLIMHKTYGYSLDGFIRYSINRFLRLFPVYWVLLFIIYGTIYVVGECFSSQINSVMKLPSNLAEFIANISLIFPVLNPVTYPVRLAPATWTLTIELFFYALIGLGISRSKKLATAWLLASVTFIALKNIFSSIGIGYGNIFTASLPFSVGASLFFYQGKIRRSMKKIGTKTLLTAFSANIVAATLAKVLAHESSWKIVLLCTINNLILSAIIIIRLKDVKKQKLKKVDRTLGDLSYPMYVYHWGAAIIASALMNYYGLANNKLMIFLTCLTITVGVSYLVNKFVNDNVERIRLHIKKGCG